MGTTVALEIRKTDSQKRVGGCEKNKSQEGRGGGVGRTRVGKEGEVSGLRENEWVRKEGRVRKRGRGREENMRV